MSETAWLSKSQRSQGTPTQTTVRKDIRVPTGHVIISDKWRGSQLTDFLKSELSVKYENHLGVVDFHLQGNLVVVYISEGDLVAGNGYKQKLAKLKSGKMARSVVFVEVTPLSEQYFPEVQKFIVLNLKLHVVSVTSQKDAASALAHLATACNHQSSNPFLVKVRHPPVEVTMTRALQSIPNLGPVKVQALMRKFTDMMSIANASIDELQSVLNGTDAQNVFKFFNDSHANS